MENKNLEKKYIDYLKEVIGISEEEFLKICENESEEFDELVTALANKECDVALENEIGESAEVRENIPADLVDFMCGPYEPDV